MPRSLLPIVNLGNSFPYELERELNSPQSLSPPFDSHQVPNGGKGLPIFIKEHSDASNDDETCIGYIQPLVAEYIKTEFWDKGSSFGGLQLQGSKVYLHVEADGLSAEALVEKRTTELERAIQVLAHVPLTSTNTELCDALRCLTGWRNERYDVWGIDRIVLRMERAAVGLFGMRAYGCHLNGYVQAESGDMKLWIAQRSSTKQTYPGMLDTLVGGGLPSGVHPDVNIIKECYEECGLENHEVGMQPGYIKPAGVVTFFLADIERGWVPDTEFAYDMQLPESWQPRAIDGEVAGFRLMTPKEVIDALLAKRFTPEAGMVVIDFLVRHGIVYPGNEPNYLAVCKGLRRDLVPPGIILHRRASTTSTTL
ncbi:hypothetical protein HDU85_002973 [Gaertneriomyces sp. JEL0708]|nr:hypothetical protein HDU85_002973 [Gaertneriomyces sp. JEL0708]